MEHRGGGHDAAAYRLVVDALKKQPEQVTSADVAARVGIPLGAARDLLTRAADEYAASLAVTQSGEICYTFPRVFKSRYRGVWARAIGERVFRWIKRGAAALFKVWIMVMLVGYFVLFMVIALGALLISLTAGASREDSRDRDEGGRGLFFVAGLFDLIIRLWFYHEITKDFSPSARTRSRQMKGEKKPLYQAIFSFVFGDGDEDKDWPARENKAIIAYLRAHNGVIALPELMALTGKIPADAEARALACCAQFEGMPEATPEGTLVYRFDRILLGADSRNKAAAPLERRLSAFSSNPKGMNIWFGILNGINALFGGYFLLNAGALDPSFLYRVADAFASLVVSDTRLVMTLGLGAVPLAFSALFWIIPGIRYAFLKKRTKAVNEENGRKRGFRVIWERPLEARPENMAPDIPGADGERIIKEMGAYAAPEVAVDTQGNMVYVFSGLEREKEALKTYRLSIDPRDSDLGDIVFDTR